MSAPLVVETADGTLLWVQSGRLWRAARVCERGYAPWERTDDAPGIGGRVLTEREVSLLVAPYGVETSKGSEHA